VSRHTPIPIERWTDPRHVRGAEGEARAAAWLAERGWEVLATRFRVGRHDLDLVARRDGLVAFVEVKTRSPSRVGDGREAVGWRKQRLIARLAHVWQARYGRPGDRYRFDVITVAADPWGGVVHLPDAWRIR
jgi:putative endonuclease